MADTNGIPITLTENQLRALRARVAGPVLRSGDPGRVDAIGVWNGLAAKVPALVLQATTPADVVAGVELARDRGLLPSSTEPAWAAQVICSRLGLLGMWSLGQELRWLPEVIATSS